MRRFDYSRYPPYFNIRINKGEYAWKPVIFSEVFEECRCSVGWFDAGNLLYEPLHWMRKVVQAKGFYSPLAKGTVAEWTHPATLAYLKAAPSISRMPNLAGYCVAANYYSPKARLFVERWKECALDEGLHRARRIEPRQSPAGYVRFIDPRPPDAPAVVSLEVPSGV